MTLLLDAPSVLVAIMVGVLTPLALRIADTGRLWRAAVPTGIGAAASLWFAPGALAIITVAPYCLVCALAGLIGVRRLLGRPVPVSQLAINAGLIVLAGAAVWLVAYRAGYALLGYPPFWVLLTVAHFHVAGAFLAIVIGWCVHDRGRLAATVAIGCVVGVPLTALGFVGPHALEIAGALVMAASGFGAAIVLFTTPRGLLRIAGIPLAAGMVLAAAYALRDYGTAIMIGDLDPLSSMIISHGVLDTIFAALALAALARESPRVLAPPPLSRLRGGWHVGATFFDRRQISRTPTPAPCGLVDSLDDLGHAGLMPAEIAPAIRTFYENTAAHEMIVRPRWRFGFRTGARVWAALARRFGQLQLPVHAESGREGITSRIVALAAELDGRRSPRAWIRTYPDGRALYVAAYATHQRDERAYMNIAFPLPGGQLSSVLRMDRRGDGVRVSTRLGGDCGVWLVVRGLPIRLPLSETIDVWTTDDPSAPSELRAWAAGYSTIARHDLWLFGIHYLTLEYAMRPLTA